MKLHVFYRCAPGGNRKQRPPWFTKWICLGSLLRSADQFDPQGIEWHFVCDGELPEPVPSLLASKGTVHQLGGIGNSASYRRVVAMATTAKLPGDDGVYLVEDDYLHVPSELAVVSATLAASGAMTYLTPYDHPDRYSRSDDLSVPGPVLELLGAHHWRRVESTNMTFATTARTLMADRWFHVVAASFKSYPVDRALWRTLQGLGLRSAIRWLRGTRPLRSPIPSLATHCENGSLAPAVDWAELAAETRLWLEGVLLPTEVGW